MLVGHLETLCCPSLDVSRHSLLETFMMAQSLDASLSSLTSLTLIVKSFAVAEVHVFDFCFAVLNSLGWNSILTS